MNITIEISNKYLMGKIYKVVDIGYNKCYVGSTCAELSHRMSGHINKYKGFINGKEQKGKVRVYDLFNEYGVENCKIELIEYYPCDTLNELERREGEHIRNNESVNKVVAGRTKQEYYHDKKDKILEFMKNYYKEHQDKLNEYSREYIKEYYPRNKDKLNEYSRNYSKKKTLCGCGKEYLCGNKHHHKISRHHQKWLEENKN